MPAENKATASNWLLKWAERKIIYYFNKLGPLPERAETVHLLDEAELSELKKIEASTVLRAAGIGFTSAICCAGAVIFAYYYWEIDPDEPFNWYHFTVFWAFVGSVTLLMTLLEFYFLYIDGIRNIAKLAHVAGIDLSKGVSYYHTTLAEAILEMPPPQKSTMGIDPLKKASKPRLVLFMVLYKGKIILTNILLKLLVGRILGRVALRGALELIAIPVTAFWDAWVCKKILREARLRIIAPSAVEERIHAYLQDTQNLSENLKNDIIRAIAVTVITSEHLHPNLAYLLKRLQETLQPKQPEYPVNEELLLQNIVHYPHEYQQIILKWMAFAILIDGHISRKDVTTFAHYAQICNVPIRKDGLFTELKKLYQGKPFSISSIIIEQ